MIRFLKSDLLLLPKLKISQIQCFGRNRKLSNYLSFFLRIIGTECISWFSRNCFLTSFDFLCLQLTNFVMSTLLSTKRSFRTWPALLGVLPIVQTKYKFNQTSKLWEAGLYMSRMKLDSTSIYVSRWPHEIIEQRTLYLSSFVCECSCDLTQWLMKILLRY